MFLSFVGDPCFDEEIKHLIDKHNIGEIYTPHPVVWAHLKKVLARLVPHVLLQNESPVSTELVPYRAAWEFAQSLLIKETLFDTKQVGKMNLDAIQIASLFRHAEIIPSMCDRYKLHALYEISRYSPAGDIVEIGSWWGKSAFILLQLGRLYEIGNVLCVVPWSDVNLLQDKEIVDTVSAQFSADEAFNVYKLNLLPYVSNNMNYLRMPSIEGEKYYREHVTVKTPEFGSVTFKEWIAILHIDGNHSYESVKADIDAWSGYVEKNGWIIFDDYVWPFGDGTKRVGDEFVLLHVDKIVVSFVMGSDLFIQISDRL